MSKVTTILSISASQFQSPIHAAAHEGNLLDLRHILQQTPSLIDQRNERHKTPLYICCEHGHLRCVQYLIEQCADVNYAIQAPGKERGATPLWIAARKGFLDIVQELLRNRAEVGKAVVGGITPLYIAAEEGHTSIVHELLNYGANVNRAAYNGNTPLFVASYRGHAEVVEKLIEYHASVNKTSSGLTPLYAAAQEGHQNIVRLLLRFGADLDKDNSEGNTPLFAAAEYGHVGIVQELLRAGANVDAANDHGATPLWIASVNGYHKVVHELLLADAEVDYDTDIGVSPLYTAAANGHLEVVKELLARDAQVDKMYGDTTPLFVASENGFEEVVKELLTHEANVDLCTDDRASPLYVAASCGYTRIVEMLIAAQSRIDLSCRGYTPLMTSAQNGHTDVVRLLLTHKADVDAQRDDGLTSLYAASHNGHSEIVECLLRWKCQVDVPHNGKTALYVACQNGHEQVVQLLVENGANINWKRSLAEKLEAFSPGTLHESPLPHEWQQQSLPIDAPKSQEHPFDGPEAQHLVPSPAPQSKSASVQSQSSQSSPVSPRNQSARNAPQSAPTTPANTHIQSISQRPQQPHSQNNHSSPRQPLSAPSRHTAQRGQDFSSIQSNGSSRSSNQTDVPHASNGQNGTQYRQRGRAQSYSVASTAAHGEHYRNQPFASSSADHQPANMTLRQQAMLVKTFGRDGRTAHDTPQQTPPQPVSSPPQSPHNNAHHNLPSPIAMASSRSYVSQQSDHSSVNVAPQIAPLKLPHHSPRDALLQHSVAAPSPLGQYSARSGNPPINGITPIAAACIWNHPKIVKYLLSKDADITILTDDGLSLYDLNINPEIDELLTRHQTKKDINLSVRDIFVEKIALKTDVLEKDDIFTTDLEVLWELLRHVQAQEFIVQHVPRSSVLKTIYDRAKEELGNRNAPFKHFEHLMHEYHKYQDKVLQQNYIFDHALLTHFYRRVFQKFTEAMIGALITNQKTLQNADVTVNPGANPMAPKNLAIPSVMLDNETIPIMEYTLLLMGLTKIIQHCTEKRFDSFAQKEIMGGEYSLVSSSVAKVTKLTEQIARRLTLRYEHQIHQLTPQSVVLASEIAVSRLLHYLTHNEFNTEDAIDKQIMRIIFRFRAIHPKHLETTSPVLGIWTADGMFRCSGIRTKLHTLYRLPGSELHCNQPENYGFRLGSQKEVQSLTMTPTDMTILRQQYGNPIFQLIARREPIPRFATDKHANQLELKVMRMEQAYRVQQERFEQAERLLLQQNETIRRLKQHLVDDDWDDAEDGSPIDAKKARNLERRVKTLVHTMKQFEGALDEKNERQGLTRKDSRTCAVM